MKAVAYIRVSTKKQGEVEGKRIVRGNGLEAQQESIRQFCEREGIDLVDEFVEVETGKGSDALDQRPQLAAALKQAKRCDACIIVSKLDRLSRDVHFVSGLMKDKKCRIVVVQFGLNADEFTMHIYASLAEKERAMISERTKAGLARVKANGKTLGSKNIDAVRAVSSAAIRAKADENAARIMPTIESLRAAEPNISYRQIASKLNASKIPTARGAKWTAVQVSRVLSR